MGGNQSIFLILMFLPFPHTSSFSKIKINITSEDLKIYNKTQSGTVMKSVGSGYLSQCLGLNYITTSYPGDLGQIIKPQFLICKMGIIVVLTS